MLSVGIVVGPDQLGKTPLIGLIKKAMPEIEVRQVLKDPTMLDREEPVNRARLECDWWHHQLLEPRTIIYDRFPYPDDNVYDFLNDGNNHYPVPWNATRATSLLGGRIKAYKVRFLLVLPKDVEAYKAQLEDPLIPEGKVDYILKRYREFAEWCLLNDVDIKVIHNKYFGFEDALEAVKWLSPHRHPTWKQALGFPAGFPEV